MPVKFIKQPQQITLFTRPMCSWCMDVKEWLAEQWLECTVVDVGVDQAGRQRAIELSGQTLVPVIKVDGLVLGDFDVGQLKAFLKKHGYLA